MLFSCIVPVFNIDREYLHQCVQSIVGQTFTDFELILVDDGSQQDTAAYCDMLAKTDERISVIHQPNKGLAGARNTGIAHAKGQWIVHVDGDDWVEPVLLERIAATADPSRDIVLYGYCTSIGGEKKPYLLRDKTIFERPYEEIKPLVLQAAMRCGQAFADIAVNTTWGKAFRRDFVKNSGISFHEELRRSQDVPYSLDAFLRAQKIAYIDEALYVYRLDNESLSRGYNDKTFERMTKTAAVCQDFCRAHPEYPMLQTSASEFSRRCFVNIISNDYLNVHNPKPWKTRKKEFIAALKQEPYATAFDQSNLKSSRSRLDSIEIRLIAMKQFEMVYLFRKLRAWAGSVAGR